MHEFSIAQAILDLAEQEARQHPGTRIQQVGCRIGVLQQVVPELLVEAFGSLVEGSRYAGARIDIEKDPLTIECSVCGHRESALEWRAECRACGALEIRVTGGDQLFLTSIVLEETDGDPGHTECVQAE